MTIPKEVQLLLDALRVKQKPLVTNQRVQSAVDELYRPNPTIYPGGIAAAIIYESLTGNLVNGKSHRTKGEQRKQQIKKILTKENLSSEDEEIARDILEELEYGLRIAQK